MVSLHDRDHLDVRAFLAERGIEADRILLLTNLRVLGYVFNPVSFFYCYRDDELACIVAEVSNTFGERLPYLLSPENRDAGERRLSYRHDKKLHVSPFFGLEQSYQWWFSEPGERLDVRIDLSEGGARPFFATLTGTRRPLTSATLARALHSLSADAAAGDRPDPPPGGAALAEARAVLPQAAVRARRGIGEAMTEVLRELPAGRRVGARSPSAPRSGRSAGSSTARSSCASRAGTSTAPGRATRSSSPSRRTTSSAGSRAPPASASASPTPPGTGTPTTSPA